MAIDTVAAAAIISNESPARISTGDQHAVVVCIWTVVVTLNSSLLFLHNPCFWPTSYCQSILCFHTSGLAQAPACIQHLDLGTPRPVRLYSGPTVPSDLHGQLRRYGQWGWQHNTVLLVHAVTVRDILASYEVGETIGVGGFAVVKRGRDRQSGEVVAIKVVDKWRYATEESSEREIRILSKVNHRNCIQLHAVYVTAKRVYIVTEFVTGGELLDAVTERGHFSEEVAAYLIKQVLEGVAYLHSKGIVHGDLKLENILLEGTMPCVTVKIADFGLSKVFASSPARATVCGSPLYMAPELITLDQKRELAPAVDVWSVGVILFILLAGYAPFDDDDDAVLFAKIKAGKCDVEDPVWETISAGAKSLVSRMLCVDAAERLTSASCLQDEWLRSHEAAFANLHHGKLADGNAAHAQWRTSAVSPLRSERQTVSVTRLLSARSVRRQGLPQGEGEGGWLQAPSGDIQAQQGGSHGFGTGDPGSSSADEVAYVVQPGNEACKWPGDEQAMHVDAVTETEVFPFAS